MPYNNLIEELNEFLSENRRKLTGTDVKLLEQIISELKRVDNSCTECWSIKMHRIADIIMIVMRLLEIN